MWPGPFKQPSFSHLKKSPYEIWVQLAQWFQRKRCLKCWWTTLCIGTIIGTIILAQPTAFSSGELKIYLEFLACLKFLSQSLFNLSESLALLYGTVFQINIKNPLHACWIFFVQWVSQLVAADPGHAYLYLQQNCIFWSPTTAFSIVKTMIVNHKCYRSPRYFFCNLWVFLLTLVY